MSYLPALRAAFLRTVNNMRRIFLVTEVRSLSSLFIFFSLPSLSHCTGCPFPLHLLETIVPSAFPTYAEISRMRLLIGQGLITCCSGFTHAILVYFLTNPLSCTFLFLSQDRKTASHQALRQTAPTTVNLSGVELQHIVDTAQSFKPLSPPRLLFSSLAARPQTHKRPL